jgi:hypothetical protein
MRTAIVAGLLSVLSLSVACGARTELPGLRAGEDAGPSTGTGGEGGTTFAGPIATSAGGVGGDGGGGNDGGGGQNEGGSPPFEPCDPDVLFIYLVTSETDLYRFDPSAPPAEAFELIGSLQCPTQLGGTPFSMAVSRSGRAYSVYNSGELFRVNVKNAACTATDWAPPPSGEFTRFGMGYALDADGGGETLYVADITFEDPSAGLGTIDTTDFSFRYIGPFSENPGRAIELTSSDDGALYGYFLNDGGGGTVVRIDEATGAILEATPLDVGAGGSLAFAYWGGDFYIFNGQGGGLSQVWRYRPDVGSVELFAELPREIVGAGVTTCDPEQAG